METKKEKLINRQKNLIKAFKVTIYILLGFLFCIWMTWVMAQADVLVKVMPAINLLLIILVIIGILMIVTYFAIGKKEKPKSNDALEQIEKLGKLKAQGLISEQEFEKEKKKLWEQE